jgi:hypothetical protein
MKGKGTWVLSERDYCLREPGSRRGVAFNELYLNSSKYQEVICSLMIAVSQDQKFEEF